jgi:hypothetical protein
MVRAAWDDSTRRMIAECNSVPILSEDLTRVVEEVDTSSPETRDMVGHAITAVRLFNGDPDRVQAIMFRLEALVNLLLQEESVTAWTITLPDGSVLTSEPIFGAAATQPLIESKGEVAFDRESFLAKVLELAEVDQIG